MDQVGRYQIIEELGRGAHGVVYKALDPAIGRTIAIKAIALGNIEEADRARVREGILREARLAGTLSHPNIITVYDVLDHGDAAYIFMEFVDGESMEDAIAAIVEQRPEKLSRAQFLSILRQVAQALDYAHRKGVIHRDVKPANIVLTTSEGGLLAKIADFGVAKFASHDVTQQLGGRHALIGTPSYMAPEQVQGWTVSGASDQFSLAVIAYEVLCGRKAFKADTVEALLYRIANEREQDAHVANTALSATVTKVLRRALAKNPTDRYATCSEFAGALEFALGDSSVWEPGMVRTAAEAAATALVSYTPELPEEEKSWGKTLVMIVGLCLAVFLAIVLIVRMNSGPPVTTQVLDTKSGPVSPAPSIEELQYERRAPAPLDLSHSPAKKPQTGASSPTVVNVPVPVPEARTPPVKVEPNKMAPVRPATQVISSGEVQLSSDPPGASILVDGRNSCTAPCSINLPAGRHTLIANLDGFASTRRIFNIPADKNMFLMLPKSEGVLLVTSEPTGAAVNVDGRNAGATPITLRLAAGAHRVSVWDGTRWHDENIQIASDEVHTRTFRF